MVSTAEIRRSNAKLSSTHQTLTAVFVGATSGIGLATLQAFARHVPEPNALIVGRSKAKFSPHLKALERINSKGNFQFLETDVSLLRNIDDVSAEIKKGLGESKIDLLFQSQGCIGFSGRQENADGLDIPGSLRYYGRMRFIDKLLPSFSDNARVVSVLAGGLEGKINVDDLELKKPGNYSTGNAASHTSTMNTLAMEKLAEDHPNMGFVHYFPGLVNTDMLVNSTKGILHTVLRWIVMPIVSLFAMSAEKAGERGLYNATNPGFARDVHILNARGGPAANEAILAPHRKDGTRDKVWDHTQDTFQFVLGL